MRDTAFGRFLRSGGSGSVTLDLAALGMLATKQARPSPTEAVEAWFGDVWDIAFAATTATILRNGPTEFSAAGLSGLDGEALRTGAAKEIADAMQREGFDLESREGRARAMTVLPAI